MGRRTRLPRAAETAVLLRSRRRCCLCWALNGADEERRGQVAHLDRDPSNHDADNLAYLCLEHHDGYDGRSSQSKGFTIDEVKAHRDAMYAVLETRGAVGAQRGSGEFAQVGSVPYMRIVGEHNVVAGRDVHIKYGRVTSRRRSLVVPGTVGEDARMIGYLKYLVRRFNELKEWECGAHMRYPLIYVSYRREMKYDLASTPTEMFRTACEYLQRRIRGTKLGRIKAAEGNRLFDSFDEFVQASI